MVRRPRSCWERSIVQYEGSGSLRGRGEGRPPKSRAHAQRGVWGTVAARGQGRWMAEVESEELGSTALGVMDVDKRELGGT